MRIRILGTGCSACKKAEATAQEAAAELGVVAQVELVSDYKTMLSYGVMAPPGLVVDDVLRCSGRIPSKAEVRAWITSTMTKQGSSS